MTGLQPSLQGLRILNTRPLEQSRTWSHEIRALGGIAIDLPTLAIEPITSWFMHLPPLQLVKQVIFISANAVHHFFSALKQGAIAWPTNIQITAIGKATAAALLTYDVTAQHIPRIADSEHLLMLDSLQHVGQQTILLIKGEDGRTLINDKLKERGARLIPLSVYRGVLPPTSEEFLNSLWHDDAVDIILFTSQQVMSNLFTLFGKEAKEWLCGKPCLVISERLATEAARLGMQHITVSGYDKVLETLQRMNS
jgi:uroporphyrinogen-III synthase